VYGSYKKRPILQPCDWNNFKFTWVTFCQVFEMVTRVLVLYRVCLSNFFLIMIVICLMAQSFVLLWYLWYDDLFDKFFDEFFDELFDDFFDEFLAELFWRIIGRTFLTNFFDELFLKTLLMKFLTNFWRILCRIFDELFLKTLLIKFLTKFVDEFIWWTSLTKFFDKLDLVLKIFWQTNYLKKRGNFWGIQSQISWRNKG
jgi:hypothetical protein